MRLHYWEITPYLITQRLEMLNLFDSILEAVLTVSPKRQYRGILAPTTPATTGPECTPDNWMNLLKTPSNLAVAY